MQGMVGTVLKDNAFSYSDLEFLIIFKLLKGKSIYT